MNRSIAMALTSVSWQKNFHAVLIKRELIYLNNY
jgi:hypothetical protein